MPKQDSIPGLSQLLKCPICLGLLSVACDTNCGHAFCAPCILQHLKHSARCPLCREEITSAHPSFVLRTMVESYRSARHGTDSAPAKDGKLDVDTAEKGVGESPGPLPAGLGSTLRHSASMSSMSSLNSVDDERYDTLLRENTAATRMGYTGGVNESSLLRDSHGSAARGEAFRAGLASQWLLAHKPIIFVIGCVAVFFLVALIIVLMQWSCVLPSPVPPRQSLTRGRVSCPLFYPALALVCSGLAWAGSMLVYIASTPWLGRGTRFAAGMIHFSATSADQARFQVRAKQEAALFVVFTCFTAFAIFVCIPLPYCLLLEDCVTTCSGSLRYLLEFTTILSWLLCVEILALLLPWVWVAWAVFGGFRIVVSLVTCKPDFCSGFYETNFREWPSMGVATLEAARDVV